MRSRSGRAAVAGQQRLAGPHPVAVALHGVDLAVVGDVAERVGQRPRREGVGREAGVHQRQRRLDPLVAQVGEELAQLRGGEHALVDERAARQAREVDAALSPGRADLVLDALAHDVDPALERVVDQPVAGQEDLAERRLDRLGGGADHRVVDRHLAPAEDAQALATPRSSRPRRPPRRPWPDRPAGRRCRWRRRPRGAAAKPTTSRRKRSGIWMRMPAPSPVLTSLPDAPAVLEVAQGADALAHDVVAAQALHVDDEVDAARVVLERGVVEALSGRQISHEVFPGDDSRWECDRGCRDDAGPTAERRIVHSRAADRRTRFRRRVSSRRARQPSTTPEMPLVHRRVPVAVPRGRRGGPPTDRRRLRRGGRARRLDRRERRAAGFLRRGGSLVAWVDRPGRPPRRAFRIVGAHTDSPNLRVKPRPDLVVGRVAAARRRDLRRRAPQLVARPRPRPVGPGRPARVRRAPSCACSATTGPSCGCPSSPSISIVRSTRPGSSSTRSTTSPRSGGSGHAEAGGFAGYLADQVGAEPTTRSSRGT